MIPDFTTYPLTLEMIGGELGSAMLTFSKAKQMSFPVMFIL